MKRFLALILGATTLLAFGSAGASPITPTKLIGGKLDQIEPTINGTYIGWTQNSSGDPSHRDAFYETLPVGSGLPVKMNAGGTFGFMPSFDGDTNNAVLQQSLGSSSDIVMYNLNTQSVSPPPSGVNTGKWEWWPTLSEGFIEFGRHAPRANPVSKILLYDPNTLSTVLLAKSPKSCFCVYPGQVSSTYATFMACGRGCNVYYYTIADQTTTKIPNPHNQYQSAPSVDAATQTFYYLRAGSSCGSHAKIMRWTIGDPSATVVANLPSGYEVGYRTFDYIDGTPNDNIVFDLAKCSRSGYSDVYEVLAANTASPTVSKIGSVSGRMTLGGRRSASGLPWRIGAGAGVRRSSGG